ncbi:MAG: phosphoenolpyruvate synthase [Candidatus Aenigmarchaeota archaeon]|nr:phosphoenolpyruvate synthase [Candidatus Aenigmarchaeota archaeon]
MNGKYKSESFVLWFDELRKTDTPLVGGKNSSLGEMISQTNVPVPHGFAITSNAYWYFIRSCGLEEVIRKNLTGLDTHNMAMLRKVGKSIRSSIIRAKIPEDLEKMVMEHYKEMCKKSGKNELYVAVRSSATAEDLPDASFAGQQDTYLNITGRNILKAVKYCIASLFTDRAISYRVDKNFDHLKVALSVGIQEMVNSRVAGVMFTIDPDTGFKNMIVIEGAYGLGENVVQGKVTPDEFHVFKPKKSIIMKKLGSKEKMLIRTKKGNKNVKVDEHLRKRFVLSESDVLHLAEYGMKIEKHYGRPMDIEWAKGDDHKLYILQARPETVHSSGDSSILKKYILLEDGKILVKGQSIGRKIGQGKVNIIKDVKKIDKFKPGEVLVTGMTDPSWEPIMKIASAIVTERGGLTCHAAIVSRELGIPCIIGSGNATKVLKTGQPVTVDCTRKEGFVKAGILKYKLQGIKLDNLRNTKTKVLVNAGIPEEALEASCLPVDGIGLAREEFITSSSIGEHPLHMIEQHREDEYIKKLSEGIAGIAAPFYPRPVILRLADFKTNEYASLEGGAKFEPLERNPMIGWRGASRYIDPKYEPAFRLECRAIKRVRDVMGLTNLKVMVPFCRTVNEAEKVLKIMKSEGLESGKNDLEVYMMAEIPSNVILADQFSKLFDGFSIGSNDLTQLTLGIDRDNEKLLSEFDERNDAVKMLISNLIKTAHKYKRHVGICGEAPSNYPEYVEFLVKEGIDTISVNVDAAVKTKLMVTKIELGDKKKTKTKAKKK